MTSSRRAMLRNSAAVAVGATAFGAIFSGTAEATSPQRFEAQQCAEIEAVVKSYELSLNAGDVEGIVRLFTPDAAVLVPNAPTAVGSDAVRAAYTGVFQAIDIDITFTVAEVQVVSPEWAFLRSTSNGTATILANGVKIPSSNQELFVLRKSQGRWKLARYSFSSALPSA